MRLACEAIDSGGQAVTETVDAAGPNEAMEMLRRRGLFVVKVKELAEGKQLASITPGKASGLGSGTKRLRFLISFARQVQVLISTGTPLAQALAAIERQTPDPAQRAVVHNVHQSVEQGASLSEAMRQEGDSFDPVMIGVVEAGEASGTLENMMSRLVVMLRKQLQLRRMIIGALTYPLLLIVLSFAVVILMLVFVVPRFGLMFSSLDAELPPTTKVMLFLSDGLRTYWWIIAPLFAAFLGGGAWMALSAKGKLLLNDWLLLVPKIGGIARELISARIMRLLGLLLDSNVSMLEALNLVRGAAGHRQYADMVERATHQVSNGESLSSTFEQSNLVGPSVIEAIRNGEESGQLGPLLLNVSEFMDEENEIRVKGLSALIEPLILIGLGLMVGIVAISIFIPLFDLTAAGGGP